MDWQPALFSGIVSFAAGFLLAAVGRGREIKRLQRLLDERNQQVGELISSSVAQKPKRRTAWD